MMRDLLISALMVGIVMIPQLAELYVSKNN
jgi:hypothetical protein